MTLFGNNDDLIWLDEEKEVLFVKPEATYEDIFDYVVYTLNKDFTFYRKVESTEYANMKVNSSTYSSQLFSFETDSGKKKYMKVRGNPVKEIQFDAVQNEINVPYNFSANVQTLMDKLKKWSSDLGEEANNLILWSRYTDKDIPLDENTLLMIVESGNSGLIFSYYPIVTEQNP